MTLSRYELGIDERIDEMVIFAAILQSKAIKLSRVFSLLDI